MSKMQKTNSKRAVPKTLSAKFVNILLTYICMPIFLACICFILLYVAVSSRIGRPELYLQTIRIALGGDQTPFDSFTDIFDPDANPLDPSKEDPGGQDGQNGTGTESDPNDGGSSGQGGTNGGQNGGSDGAAENGDGGSSGNGQGGGQDSGSGGGQDGDQDGGSSSGGSGSDGEDGGSGGDGELPDQTIPLSSIEFPRFNYIYGRFEIESVDISYELIMGESEFGIARGVCQTTDSYIPGYGGTTKLTIHNNKVRRLENLKVGDEIKITTNYGVYRYRTTSIEVIDSSDSEALRVQQSGYGLLFYTCYPLNKPSTTQRLLIRAEMISGPKIVKD